MRAGRHGRDRAWLGRLALAAVVLAGHGHLLAAAPVDTIETVPEGAAVLDIRAERSCLAAAPAGARCLPAETLLGGADGAPVGFHALRWVLGALGLTGAETLAVYPGDEVPPGDALAVAGLLHLAGQRDVLVLSGPVETGPDGGQTRGMWRQVIYTAPMRVEAMRVDATAAGRPGDRLRDYARDGGTVAFAPSP